MDNHNIQQRAQAMIAMNHQRQMLVMQPNSGMANMANNGNLAIMANMQNIANMSNMSRNMGNMQNIANMSNNMAIAMNQNLPQNLTQNMGGQNMVNAGKINMNNHGGQQVSGNNELKSDSPPPSPSSVKACTSFNVHKPKQPGLRANVFVSKDCTRDLAKYIVDEYWGQDNGMLYKYLDYIFRCQIFDQQVKKITFFDENEIVVFHTGLQRRADHNFLYFVLMPNDADKKNAEQRWRVPAGGIADSCVSKEELKQKWFLNDNHLPKRTKFYSSLNELLFDESYAIEVNWAERLRTNRERIYHELKTNHSDIDKQKLVQELTQTFTIALKKAENQAKANPRLAVAQGFVETKHYKKRVELLLPLNVEYPKNSGIEHTFALALRKSHESNVKKYTGMSLLTMSMAYANARLVGYVDSSWLTNAVQEQDSMSSQPNSCINTNVHSNTAKMNEVLSPHNIYATGKHGQQKGPFFKKMSMDASLARSRSRFINQQLHNQINGSIPEEQPLYAVIDSQSHQSKVYPMSAMNAMSHGNYNINNIPHRTIDHSMCNVNQNVQENNMSGGSRSLHYAKSMPPPPELHHKIEDSHDLGDLEEGDDYGVFEKEIVDDVFENDIKIPRSAPPKPTHYMFAEEKDFNDHIASVHSNMESSPASSLTGHRKTSYLLQVRRLPADCGVNMLRQIFGVIGENHLRSVHYVHEDKIAILRFSNESSMNKAHIFGSRFGWKIERIHSNSKRSKMLAYRDQQQVWEFQTSNSWTPHPHDFAAVIDQIAERSSMFIKYLDSTYYIERYNDRQGQQTNWRTKNQRMIRRITILVWAPATSSMRKEFNSYVDPLMEFYWGTYNQSNMNSIVNNNNNVVNDHHMMMHQSQDNNSVHQSHGHGGGHVQSHSHGHGHGHGHGQMMNNNANNNNDRALNASANVFKPSHNMPAAYNKKLSMTRSVPPEVYYHANSNNNSNNNSNVARNVRAQQQNHNAVVHVNGDNKSTEVDSNDYYGVWTHVGDYNDEIKDLKTKNIKGIWNYTGNQIIPSHNESLDTDHMWFCDTWDITQDIFETGFKRNTMYTFFENVVDACDQCDEASDVGDIRLFHCKLYLENEEQFNYCKQQRSVCIRDCSRIHLQCCIQINKDVLEDATNNYKY